MPPIKPSDGPVAITGASGYIGSWAVYAFVRRGYTVHACVRDASDPAKVEHLKKLSLIGDPALTTSRSPEPGQVKIFEADLTVEDSYTAAIAGCSCVVHVGTPMGYGGANDARQIFDGAVEGTMNLIATIKQSPSVKRLIYTSSFAAVGHPAPAGYVYTEKDWASDGRESDPLWNFDEHGELQRPLEENWEAISKVGDLSYSMAKVITDKMSARIAAESGQFDAIVVNPCVVLGPCMTTAHELVGSWQWVMARMLAGKPCLRGHQALWNICDVRDCGEIQACIAESSNPRNGDRYNICATDDSGELNVFALQAKLMRLFPDIRVGGAPEDGSLKRVHDGPRGHCDLARSELGLTTHHIDDTLKATGDTMIKLGLCEPMYKPAKL
jgi:dihydroflavonol-4-reductase